MTRGSARRRAVANAARLKRIIERQLVGDALRSDAQGSRRNQGHYAMSKSRSAAAIINDCRARAVRGDSPHARLISMLELRQLEQVRKALAKRHLEAWRSIDLPQARTRLREDGGALSGSGERKHQN